MCGIDFRLDGRYFKKAFHGVALKVHLFPKVARQYKAVFRIQFSRAHDLFAWH